MSLALFDLDNTLLNGDSDHAWGLYLADIGVLDAAEQMRKQDYFYQQYVAGELDMEEFLAFQLKPLAEHAPEDLHTWRERFLDSVVSSMISSGKPELLDRHREAGDELVIITATNDFITRPIADKLGVKTLIATTAEMKEGLYTGRSCGTPCYQQGKVERLQQWLSATGLKFTHTIFYSDSINDLPLLQTVDEPVAVTPDDKLRAHAERLKWKIID